MSLWLLGFALANPAPIEVAWKLEIDGMEVGQRTATYQLLHDERGPVQIMQALTEIDARIGDRNLKYTQRLSSDRSMNRPAAFQAVIQRGNRTSEVQAREIPTGWRVISLGTGGEQMDLPADAIQLTTVDLLDPDSLFRPVANESLRLLSADDGRILFGNVSSLGQRSVRMEGEQVQLTGWRIGVATGNWDLWYAPNGFLVDFDVPLGDYVVRGHLVGELPRGVDEVPNRLKVTVEAMDL